VGTRQVPLLTLPSGTQQARSRIGDNDPTFFLIREFVDRCWLHMPNSMQRLMAASSALRRPSLTRLREDGPVVAKFDPLR
jgi:hypothetical protein